MILHNFFGKTHKRSLNIFVFHVILPFRQRLPPNHALPSLLVDRRDKCMSERTRERTESGPFKWYLMFGQRPCILIIGRHFNKPIDVTQRNLISIVPLEMSEVSIENTPLDGLACKIAAAKWFARADRHPNKKPDSVVDGKVNGRESERVSERDRTGIKSGTNTAGECGSERVQCFCVNVDIELYFKCCFVSER